MENKRKKRYGIVAALLLLVLTAGVGTYAWLTAQSSLTNNFTTAGINKPHYRSRPSESAASG